MSGSFLVSVTEPGRESLAPPRLTLCFAGHGVAVWADRPVIPVGDHGCIIGHLFPIEPGSLRVDTLDQHAIDRIERSSGRSLLTDFWGGYVAVFVGMSGQVCIVRDPSGALPCYYAGGAGRIVIASGARQIVTQSADAGRIDYKALARFIAAGNSVGPATCLAGVSELLPGECLVIKDRVVATQIWWSPWEFTDRLADPSREGAATTLRRVVLDCVDRWASSFDSIVMGVSGGLDSSIVAAGCVKSKGNLRCLTMVGPDASGDETSYARALTDALNLPLSSHHYDIGAIDIRRSVLAHLPRPMGAYFLQGIETAHRPMAADRPIDAIFTGHGGDNVFCSIRSASPLLDRWRERHSLGDLLTTLRDISDLTGASFATILGLAVRKATSSPHHVRADLTGLRKGVIEKLGLEQDCHPWTIDAPDAPRGKVAHVAMVADALRSVELYDRATHPPQIAPLLSQPVIERCLAIPTWQWIAGGVDRSVARQAFRSIVPDVLLDRTSKGGPDGFMHAIYRARGGDLKAMLKNGLLMAHGLLDPTFLDAPDDPSWKGKPRARRIMALANAECWARAWTA